ncbi:MAG: putative lipid II flippase FtsW [bacterium]
MSLKSRNNNGVDKLFLALSGALLCFGLIMLTSASASIGYAQFGDTYYFIKNQLLHGVLFGLVLFLLFLHIKHKFWRKLAWLVYALSIILLILVFVPSVGLVINGAHSWINVFGLFSFQPSEFAKLALVIVLARMLSAKDFNVNNIKQGVLPIIFVVAPLIGLITAQPDIGTLSIICVIIFGMLFVGKMRLAHLSILTILGVVGIGALMLAAPYRVQRLTTFLHPELDPQGIGYQINQSFLAIGSGGLFGLGLGNSRQKFQYLPEVHADSIFAIIAEETGFVVSITFVFALLFFCLRGLKIAKKAPDDFSRLLVTGIMIWLIGQSFLNIGSMVGLFPLTGVPLPFVSHGGSALMVILASIGIVMCVSREARI